MSESKYKILNVKPKTPKYPGIKVRLTGQDGNAFAVLGRIVNAMRENEVSEEEINAFRKEATSSDYDHLLITAMRYVNIR